MVASMRYWATWSGVLDSDAQGLSYYSHMILGDSSLDPWLESPISLWILHWQLVSKPELRTYFWFFNYFNGSIFDRDQLQSALIALCEEQPFKQPSAMTLKRDIDCFIRTYVSKSRKDGKISEDSLESPLSELNLINTVNRRDVFQVRRGAKSTLTPGVFLLALWSFWIKSWQNQTALSLEACTYDPFSPGRIFLLDEDAVLDMAYLISTMDLGIEWSESSGLRQFQRSVPLEKLKEEAMELIRNEYLERR